jgi:hypothetical protein
MSYISHLAALGIGAIAAWTHKTLTQYAPSKDTQEQLEERVRLVEEEIVRLDKKDEHLWNLFNIRYRPDFPFHLMTKASETAETAETASDLKNNGA